GPVEDFARAVPASVVDDDELDVAGIVHRQRLFEGVRDAFFLVIDRHEDGELHGKLHGADDNKFGLSVARPGLTAPGSSCDACGNGPLACPFCCLLPAMPAVWSPFLLAPPVAFLALLYALHPGHPSVAPLRLAAVRAGVATATVA